MANSLTKYLQSRGFISQKELAELLNINEQTLYKWAREGKIPCVRFGRNVKFDGRCIAHWLQQREVGARWKSK